MTRIAKQEVLPRVGMTRIGKQEVMARVGRTWIVMHGRLPRGKSALDRELANILVGLGVWLDIDSDRAGKLSPKKAEGEGAINTIFGGPATGKSNRERTQEIREAMEARRDLDVNSIKPDPKRIKEGWDPIIFIEADSHGVDVRPNDTLVISARIDHREVHRILIDNGSSADILGAEVYD
ncbi:hypothetical protein LWI29_034406 [Acer saccharum]|uniref:Uncharacterized protein n=1 Tax=Acer saccharum TaxID=4024 RepID=A0AA39W7N5_ACESA|nr:hypothetical protein LWI29_034406 [Acer saccharum]